MPKFYNPKQTYFFLQIFKKFVLLHSKPEEEFAGLCLRNDLKCKNSKAEGQSSREALRDISRGCFHSRFHSTLCRGDSGHQAVESYPVKSQITFLWWKQLLLSCFPSNACTQAQKTVKKILLHLHTSVQPFSLCKCVYVCVCTQLFCDNTHYQHLSSGLLQVLETIRN